MSTQPNILHIMVHDLGTDLGCYDNKEIRSPNLDAFAQEGVRLTNYFCAATACSPSRGTTMTGCYSHTNGLMGLAHLGWSIADDVKTIVDYLNEADYETVHAGAQHERPVRRDNHYQTYLGGDANEHSHSGPSTYCEAACSEAMQFLSNRAPDTKPFYLNVGFFEVHSPWDKREEYKAYPYDADALTLPAHAPQCDVTRKRLADYYSCISYMDEWCGKLLASLQDTGLADNTIVIFTTDHGREFPRAKTSLYDPGTNITLMIRWPEHIEPGSVCDELLHTIDLAPTLMTMLGLPVSPAIQGKSFWPALTGGDYTPYEHICLERNDHVSYDLQRGIRTRRYKYIRSFTEAERWMKPSDNCHAADWPSQQYSGIPRPAEELYDLEKDPNEFDSVVEDPEYADVLEDMRGRLYNWMYDTNDFIRGAQGFCHRPKQGFLYKRLENQIENMQADKQPD